MIRGEVSAYCLLGKSIDIKFKVTPTILHISLKHAMLVTNLSIVPNKHYLFNLKLYHMKLKNQLNENHNSLHKHIKNKFIQNISRLISSTKTTPITTRTVLFNNSMDVFLFSCHIGDPVGLSKLYDTMNF